MTYTPPPLTYESDPELYTFLQSLEREDRGTGIPLAPMPKKNRPKYYGRHPGNSLFATRNGKGITQSQLALVSGATRRTISAIENNRNVPSVYLALSLAEALESKVEDIFYLEPLDTVPPSKY